MLFSNGQSAIKEDCVS